MMNKIFGIVLLAFPWWAFAAESSEALTARGAYLAKVGDCIACHSAPRGKPFAGGLPMQTPVGKIYSTNITPDAQTGIGNWSEADFERALRQGVSKDGHNLYPAMPYPSYAKVSDEDVKALYAYFMKGVAPIRQANIPSEIHFPLNMRWPLKIWNVFFLDKATYKDKPEKGVEWNLGAYYVQGLGHCGSCHTPRGVAYQEKALDERGEDWLSGAIVEDWYASNLKGEHNIGLGRWTARELAEFLKTGANSHASAFGSMNDVINNSTQFMSDADIAAVSFYLKSLPPAGRDKVKPYVYDATTTMAQLARPAGNSGAKLYSTYCLQCHGADGNAHAPLLAPLAGNPNVLEKEPASIINVALNGTYDLVIQGVPAAYPMPKYRNILNDQETADVLTFIRAGWNNGALPVTATEVKKLRKTAAEAH